MFIIKLSDTRHASRASVRFSNYHHRRKAMHRYALKLVPRLIAWQLLWWECCWALLATVRGVSAFVCVHFGICSLSTYICWCCSVFVVQRYDASAVAHLQEFHRHLIANTRSAVWKNERTVHQSMLKHVVVCDFSVKIESVCVFAHRVATRVHLNCLLEACVTC